MTFYCNIIVQCASFHRELSLMVLSGHTSLEETACGEIAELSRTEQTEKSGEERNKSDWHQMSELVGEVKKLSLSSSSDPASTSTSSSSSILMHHLPVDDSTINYGTAASNLPGHLGETHYITTAIAYTNGYPHMGHAYEFLSTGTMSNRYTSLCFTPFSSLSYDIMLILLPTTDTSYLYLDALARYHRILGYDTFFLTGADEHGQKVASSAEKLGREPKVHCDVYVDAFKALCQKLCVKYDVRNYKQLTIYIPFLPLLF